MVSSYTVLIYTAPPPSFDAEQKLNVEGNSAVPVIVSPEFDSTVAEIAAPDPLERETFANWQLVT